jgi:hypothetical protein
MLLCRWVMRLLLWMVLVRMQKAAMAMAVVVVVGRP